MRVAVVLLVLAAGLLYADVVGLLASRYAPDGAVTAQFLADVKLRSRVCATILLVIAFGVRRLAAAFATRQSGGRPPHSKVSAAALIIIAIAAIARASLLDDPLHYDEAFTFNEFVSRPAHDFLSRYSHPNNHIFHTLLAHVVPGHAKWALRIPAFLAGIGLLMAMYVVARRQHGEHAALLAIALAAGATPLVEHSAQGRGYTIVALCALLLFAIPLRDDADALAAALIAAIGAWTIPVMLFPFAIWMVWLLLERTPLRLIVLAAAATAALVFVLYVPVLVVSGPRSITDNGNVQPLAFGELLRVFPRSMAAMWTSWMTSVPLVVGVALLVAALIALRRSRLAMASIIGSLSLIVALRVVPFTRVWLFLLPIFLIAAASTLTRESWPRTVVSAAAIVIAAASTWSALRATARPTFFEDPGMRDVPAVASFLRAQLPRDAAVLVLQPLDQPLAFEWPDPRVVRHGFDGDGRAELARSRGAWAVTGSEGEDSLRALGIAPRRALRAFGHATVWEIR